MCRGCLASLLYSSPKACLSSYLPVVGGPRQWAGLSVHHRRGHVPLSVCLIGRMSHVAGRPYQSRAEVCNCTTHREARLGRVPLANLRWMRSPQSATEKKRTLPHCAAVLASGVRATTHGCGHASERVELFRCPLSPRLKVYSMHLGV